MRAEGWAIATALCWGFGSLLEKRGVTIGGLAPVMGTVVRTVFSLLFLLALSFPFWAQVKTAGFKSISLIAIGGDGTMTVASQFIERGVDCSEISDVAMDLCATLMDDGIGTGVRSV